MFYILRTIPISLEKLPVSMLTVYQACFYPLRVAHADGQLPTPFSRSNGIAEVTFMNTVGRTIVVSAGDENIKSNVSLTISEINDVKILDTVNELREGDQIIISWDRVLYQTLGWEDKWMYRCLKIRRTRQGERTGFMQKN